MAREIQQIIEKIKSLPPDEKTILATVVDVVGSGYRRPGARMLIDQNGYGIGTVSGGCLEADVLERAKKVWATGAPTVITYDTTKDENSLFGLGMGCRGIVRILLETFAPESVLAGRLRRCAETRERQLVATVISGGEASPGGRFFYDRTGRFDFQNLPSGIEKAEEIKSDAREFFGLGAEAEVRRYRAGQESIEIFFENVSPPLNLLLFGAGYDALPLAKFAKELGWRVSIVDHRPAFANAERLPDADEIAVARAADLSDEFFQDEHSAAVIMTHNYDHDREILRRLLGSKCLYIGALGPKKRAEKLLAEIGGELPAERLEKLHAPVGLDIGANTPEAIALSIAAEIQAVVGRRAGGFLRERKGSIYGRGD